MTELDKKNASDILWEEENTYIEIQLSKDTIWDVNLTIYASSPASTLSNMKDASVPKQRMKQLRYFQVVM